MEVRVRNVAWAIAEAWWRKSHRRAAGGYHEASTAEEYADQFWQNFRPEAEAAIRAADFVAPPVGSPGRPLSNRFG